MGLDPPAIRLDQYNPRIVPLFNTTELREITRRAHAGLLQTVYLNSSGAHQMVTDPLEPLTAFSDIWA